MVSYYIKWVSTSWTYSMLPLLQKLEGCSVESKDANNFLTLPSVQEVVTHLCSKLLYKMGKYFLDIQYVYTASIVGGMYTYSRSKGCESFSDVMYFGPPTVVQK